MSPTSGHWRLEIDTHGIARLTLDKTDSTSNTLSSEVLEELEARLDEIDAAGSLRGVIFRSAKSTGFVLGADVNEFAALDDAETATRLAARGQALVGRIASLPVPSVAAVDGFALGGGLELALACDYRVAVEGYERTFGLPEVQLGIHPGFGGTVRAVELLGPIKGLDLMLTGRLVSAVDALELGLVDRVVERAALDSAAVDLLERRPAPRRAPWYLRILNAVPVRGFVGRRLLARVARRARREHYPAPYAIVALWVAHGAAGEEAYRAEAESIGRLLVTPQSRNLVRVFKLRERLRNLAPRSDDIRHVHVAGAGVMGGDIASWCALSGLEVTLQDRAEEYVRPAIERARKLFAKRLRAPGAPENAERRLTIDLEASEVGRADIVIEAIVEQLEAKQELYRSLEPRLKPDAVLATNTSSIRLEQLAEALTFPERFLGLHFFNPVAKLPLVEVIKGPETSEATLERGLAFTVQIGKLPLPCRSAPGFVVNRILTPYMLEALLAHEDGHALETIDAAATEFGMPVGPVELADQVGLDVALHVAEILSGVIGIEPPAALREKVDAGQLGVKSGRGFYEYEKGEARKRDAGRPDEELRDRLILPMINEAVACYTEGVVDDTDLLDAGAVFGTGFAPFRGGPIHYARETGYDRVADRLRALAARFGPRFEPHEGWQALGREET